jgi:hypothetical protein
MERYSVWNDLDEPEAVRAELEAVKKSRGTKMFTTHVEVDECEYQLVTTSKDIHLALGRFSLQGQRSLVQFLCRLFKKDGTGSLLLNMHDDYEKDVLVAKTGVSKTDRPIFAFMLVPIN